MRGERPVVQAAAVFADAVVTNHMASQTRNGILHLPGKLTTHCTNSIHYIFGPELPQVQTSINVALMGHIKLPALSLAASSRVSVYMSA
jgi:hypothetical protein